MSEITYEKAICQVVNTIADQRISQAGFDTTVEAVVIGILDKTRGKYKLKYQNNIFQAYANNSEVYYEEGKIVTVLIPNNDWTLGKLILGSKDGYGSINNQVLVNKINSNKIGQSAVKMNIPSVGLCSYKGNDQKQLYPTSEDISVNSGVFSTYIPEGDCFVLGMEVRTALGASQVGGDYGVIFELDVKDSVTGDAAVRSYVVNSTDVLGNPYALRRATKVERVVSDVDIDKILGIKSIKAYCKDFPNGELEKPDIFITDITFNAGSLLTEDQLNGYQLFIDYSQTGNKLDDDHAEIKLQAKLQIKGSECTDSDIQYYWFKQNGSIFSSSDKYRSDAGDGWECINNYAGTSPEWADKVIYFVSDKQRQAAVPLTRSPDVKCTPIKCVARYDGKRISGQTKIIDTHIKQIIIDSSDQIYNPDGTVQNKTTYLMGSGSPTFTCVIKNPDGTIIEDFKEAEKQESQEGVKSVEYLFKWSEVSAYKESNSYNIISSDINTLETLVDFGNSAYQILNKITNQDEQSVFLNSTIGNSLPDEYKGVIDPTESYANEFKIAKDAQTNPYIWKNIFYNFPVKDVIVSSKVLCVVNKKTTTFIYNEETGEERSETTIQYIGTGSITINNHMQVADGYSLMIANGDQVFQYDEKGNSPCSGHLEKPLQIQPLEYVLVDSQGNTITHQQILNNGSVQWLFPNSNTLLISEEIIEDKDESRKKITKDDLSATAADRAAAANFDIYRGDFPKFSFSIAPNYDQKKTNNYIKLIIRYKQLTITGYTNFTFPKQGDPGTNGTDYVTKLVPVSIKDDVTTVLATDRVYFSDFGTIVQNPQQDIKGETNIYDDNGKRVDKFKVQLYNNSVLIDILDGDNIKWSCPPNFSQKDRYRGQSFIKIKSDGEIVAALEEFNIYDSNNHIKTPVNIIRGRYVINGLDYFAEYPICTHHVESRDYEKVRLKIRPKTGFKYVVYSEDGASPNYDNTLPFEAIAEQWVDSGYWVQQDTKYTFEWKVIGNLDLENEDISKFKTVIPKSRYDGSDLTSAIVIIARQGDNIVGTLHVPIYMIVNRYGHSAINGWDGNSIDLGEESGMILAPQVGAGKKNDDNNTFTGIVMGQIFAPNGGQNNEDKTQVGLFGYESGQRSIFLDAETGNATFGKQGAGRIKIDAQSGQGTIASGDYPVNKVTNEPSGMKIKFSSGKKDGDPDTEKGPYIRYGSGNFEVNSDGHITAKGGGSIAGWQINDKEFYSTNRYVGLKSKVQKNIIRPLSNGTGNYEDSLAIYANNAPVFKNDNSEPSDSVKNENNNLYVDKDKVNFFVTHTGYLKSKLGEIAGWNITSSELSKNNVGMRSDTSKESQFTRRNSADTGDVKDSMAFYASSGPVDLHSAEGANFYVTHMGYLRSKAGKIASWNITQDALFSKSTDSENPSAGTSEVGLGIKIFDKDADKKAFKETNSIEARFWGTDKNALNFAVDKTGKLYSKAGKIGGWNITEKGFTMEAVDTEGKKTGIQMSSTGTLKSLNNNWLIQDDGTVDFKDGTIGGWTMKNNNSTKYIGDSKESIEESSVALYIAKDKGYLKAQAGTIGGWTINASSIESDGLILHKTGTIEANSYTITSTGISNIKLTSEGMSGTSSSGGGGGMDYNTPVYSPGGSSPLKDYIEDLTVNKLTVNASFTFGGYTVAWRDFDVVLNVTGSTTSNEVMIGIGENNNPITTTLKYINKINVMRKKLYLLTNDPSNPKTETVQ